MDFNRRGSTGPYSRRRRSSTASVHPIGGSLDEASDTWTSAVLETGHNAISTLLQPPIVRTRLLPYTSAPASSTYRPPTAYDIPPVALTDTTHVDAADFKPYLTQVGTLFEQLREVEESEDEEAETLRTRNSRAYDIAVNFDHGRLRPSEPPPASRKSSVSSRSSFPTIASSQIRASNPGSAKGATRQEPPLSTIPIVYFDENFRLENPRTFDVVSARSEVVRPPQGKLDEKATETKDTAAPRNSLATNAILQEKLSWYMDTIEMHLITCISEASTAFFAAVASLRELHSEAADSVDRIKALRKELETLDTEIVTNGLSIIHKRQRLRNLQHLHDTTLQLKHIVEGVATCESLVDNGEVEKALKSIESLGRLIAGESDPMGAPFVMDGRVLQLRDLRGVTALQGVYNDMDTLRFRISKAFEKRFLNLLIGDLRRHSEAVSTQEVLMRWTSALVRSRGGHTSTARERSVLPSYMGSIDDLRSELLEGVTGLHRVEHLTAAAIAYREALLEEIRKLIRESLTSSNDGGTSKKSAVSSSAMAGRREARGLQALGPKDAEELLVRVYVGVNETLRRFTTQVKLLLDITSSLGDISRASVAVLEAQEIHKAIDPTQLLSQAVDIAQDEIVKLIQVRSEQTSLLPLIWFLRYVTLNVCFVHEGESISGRSGTALKTVVNRQIKDYVQQKGNAERQRLALCMESDQWEEKDFSRKDMSELNKILSCGITDPTEWSDGLKIWIPCSADDAESTGEDDAQSNARGKSRIRTASIDEETFVLPNSAILCMHGVSHFLQLMVGIPSMSSDTVDSLVSYLQFFNSRCAQLILDAGARRSAGLRHITSRHLVLASRALAFITILISHVREFIRRNAGTSAASKVMELDKLTRLYQEHQTSIQDKIVEIMSRLAASHVKAMGDIDWDDDRKSVHPYMEMLVKDTTSLHRILTKTLPEGTMRTLMTEVFTGYRNHFGEAFQTMNLETELGRSGMLRDVDFFASQLGTMDGYGDAGGYLAAIIKSRQVRGGG